MEQEPELQGRTPAAYHVFINHRGPDVKKSLASLIYNRLTNCHRLRVFLDQNEIRTGDSISNAILTAIQSASVHITIFSKRYAESWWCLEELCWILRSYHKRSRMVIPVFFDVEPKELCHIESGCYKEAFDQHQSKGRVKEMEKWRTALSEASKISGITFKTEESDHGKILEKIVGIVLKEVFKWGSLDVAKYPVGLDHAAEDPLIIEILKQSDISDPMIVGIAGMSGVGKSTLAKYLYNLRRPDFNGRSCFLSDVRKNDLPSLRGKLRRDLLGCNQDLQHIGSIDEGKHLLQHCRILLVLDDVDHVDQIDGLLDMDSLERGSLILITSSDKNLLIRSSRKTLLYDVKPLNSQHGRELFCQHAFGQSIPSAGFEDIVEQFLEICKGLPLSLKVLGGHFVSRSDKEYWKRELVRFSTTLHEDITKTLKVSYDALNDEEKEAFLDIGCFLVGEETELAIRVLEGLYGSIIVHSLERLHQKCLVDFRYYVQSDGEIECSKREDPMIGCNDLSLKYRGYKLAMHDQLRELARHIARQEFLVRPTRNPLRVSSSMDIVQLWNSHGSLRVPIRGIRTSKDGCRPKFFRFRGECVYLFVLEFPIDLSSVLGSWELSKDLVWLRLRNFRFQPTLYQSNIRLPKLRVLELQGHRDNIEEFFKRLDHASIDRFSNKPRSSLNELNISGMDDEVPTTSSSRSTFDAGHSMKFSENYISSSVQQEGVTPYLFNFLKWTGLENLCKMVLTNLASLQSLPIDFGELALLRHLDLSDCTNLTELPKSFSKLLHLEYLALRECRNLSIPLDILGRISTLEYVDFKGCAQLVALPEGIPYQTNLRYLNLLFTSLSQLPEDVEKLGNLQQLRIGSPELMRLPRSVANLKGLTELIVIQCSHLQCLSPEGIVAPNIKFLTIDCCPIANFSFQKDQRTMGVLRDLTLKKTSISEICMVEGVYPWLQTIDLSENIQLKQVISLPSTLVRVNLQNCSELVSLKNLSSLVNLKFLNINGCFSLETVSIRGLISLEEIKAENCCKLKRIEGLSCQEYFSSLVNLKFLNINGCFALETLSVRGLISLEEIKAENCCKLKRIEGLSCLKNLSSLVNLKFLNINGCFVLETLSVRGLISLEEIEAEKCWKLKRIEGLSCLKGLNCLKMSIDNGAFWEDVCNFLKSPSSYGLSNFILSGKVDDEMDEGQMQREMFQLESNFSREIQRVDIVSNTNTQERYLITRIHIFRPNFSVILWFITNDVSCCTFRVNFYHNVRAGQYDLIALSKECISHNGETSGRRLHIFMWTQYSKLFNDLKGRHSVSVGCSCDASARELEKVVVERGWLLTFDDMDVLEVCNKIITIFAPKRTCSLDSPKRTWSLDSPKSSWSLVRKWIKGSFVRK